MQVKTNISCKFVTPLNINAKSMMRGCKEFKRLKFGVILINFWGRGGRGSKLGIRPRLGPVFPVLGMGSLLLCLIVPIMMLGSIKLKLSMNGTNKVHRSKVEIDQHRWFLFVFLNSIGNIINVEQKQFRNYPRESKASIFNNSLIQKDR